MKQDKERTNRDEECSTSEMRGVVYTAVSLLGGLVTIVVGLVLMLV